MALRWTAAAMHEAKKGFRRLKAFRQLRPYEPRLLLTTKRKQTATLLLKTRRPLTSFTAALASQSSTERGQFPNSASMSLRKRRRNVAIVSCRDARSRQ